MRAGELRHRVTIQQATENRDSYGAVTQTWATLATVWAAVEPLRGREFFDAARENAEVSHRIITRHYPGITPKMRVNWSGRLFDIEAVINVDERNRMLHLMCREVVL